MNTLTATDPHADFLAWMRKHGVTYSAEFVPFSKSRNAKPHPKLDDLSINWRVTLTCGGRAFSTDYQQGIGHLPERVRKPWPGAVFNRMVLAHWPIVMAAIERGVMITENGMPAYVLPANQHKNKLSPPDAADVLDSLALDCSVEDFRAYEDWAREYGYDADSRAGERIYNACRAIAADLRAILPRGALDELRAIERL